ncbi:MAG: ATP-dependent helicase [Streptosporangiales bacterium]|nr:ATP-dependent helicase [Streptosporangiales bacterium]
MCGAPPPTPEQAAVIGAPATPCVVVAGAGSGKSETMARRVVWLVANGLARPEEVLGLTFTRKAARELEVKVRGWLDRLRALPEFAGAAAAEELAGDPVVATYHAYAGRIYRMHALRDGAEPGARLVTPAVQWQLAHSVVARYDGPMDAVEWTPATVTAAVLDLAGEMSEHLVSPGDVVVEGERWDARAAAAARPQAFVTRLLKNLRVREQLLPLVRLYRQAKSDAGLLDYDDQMAAAARLASRHPAVGRLERSLFRAVLLDEYQDTSHSQLTLLRALFPDGFPVMAVGDPAQSIYSWRGATAGNLRRFPADFPCADGRPAERRELTWSFRNCERVLDVANEAVRPLATEDVTTRLVPAPHLEEPGRVECALFETVDDEAGWVAARAAGLLDDGDCRPRDIAVLVRKRMQINRLRTALEARDVPVEVVGLTGLLTVPAVADVASTLRVLYEPTANASLIRLLTGPRWRVAARDLVALGRRARYLVRAHRDRDEPPDPFANAMLSELDTGSLADALDDLGPRGAYSERGHARFRELAAELATLRQRTHLPLPELVAEVEEALRLDIEVAARPGADPLVARAELDAFAEEAARFARDDERPTLGAFLAYLDAAEEQEAGLEVPQAPDTDSVKIMTVHAAKGLEWPVVLVPGLATGSRTSVFPSRAQTSSSWTDNARLLPFPLRGDARELPRLDGVSKDDTARYAEACKRRQAAEERRLFYVAVTRAQRLLCCTGFHWADGVNPLGPSVFLTEVRDVCAAGAGTVREWVDAVEGDNPLLAEPRTAKWPVEADPRRRAEVAEGARLVRAAGDAGALVSFGTDTADEWAADVELLLAELAESRRTRDVPVVLPDRLSVSALVALARDPDAFALDLRRPVPHRPEPQARRGTAFHRWLEARWGQQRLFGPDDEPGAGDEGAADIEQLDQLRERFEASTWADRTPVDVEVPFETVVGGALVRGRMDAVFADPDGGYEVVDWKTGHPPPPGEQAATAVQLAAYRLAWSRLHGVPLESVRAAFHYVRTGETIRPVDLLDAAGLADLVSAG